MLSTDAVNELQLLSQKKTTDEAARNYYAENHYGDEIKDEYFCSKKRKERGPPLKAPV